MGRSASLKEIHNVMNRRVGVGQQAARVTVDYAESGYMARACSQHTFCRLSYVGKNSQKKKSEYPYLSVCLSIYISNYPSFLYVRGQKGDAPEGIIFQNLGRM